MKGGGKKDRRKNRRRRHHHHHHRRRRRLDVKESTFTNAFNSIHSMKSKEKKGTSTIL